MAPKALRPLIDRTRSSLRSVARRQPRLRRVMEVAARELHRALDDDVYGGGYFGADRDPYDRMGLSGYERYDRDTSNANSAAYLLWRFFDVQRTLDVGCATGFVVEALRELGLDAEGTDVSQYAVDHAAVGARGHVRYGNLLERLPVRDGSFDLVTALEVLEHLPPESIPSALGELRRVTRGWLVCTIPSFGPNANGPGGWMNAKVRPEVLDEYIARGPEFDGPIPHDDLFLDARGEPIEGHLTIASFRWWTRQFEAAGFVRSAAMERRMHPELARLGQTKYWNLYVLRLPHVPEPPGDVRSPAEVADVEQRFGLSEKVAAPDDVAAVSAALGSAE